MKAPRVGFIGLGAMGMGMARNLHAAGWLSIVWNRTRERAEALAGESGWPSPRIRPRSPARPSAS